MHFVSNFRTTTVQHLAVALEAAPILAAQLALAALTLWIFARHSSTGIALLLAAQVWTTAARGQVPALDLGFNAYPVDLVAACAFLVACARLLRHGLPARAGVLLILGMIGLTAWSVVRGISVGGLLAAAHDSRVYFLQVFAFVLYVATAPLSAAAGRAVSRAWLAAAATYGLLSLAGWAGTGLHSASTAITFAGGTIDARPVSANAALILLQGAVLLLCPLASKPSAHGAAHNEKSSARRHHPVRIAMALLLLVFVILLQHRTVWAAAAAVAVMYWGLRPSQAGKRIIVAVAGGLVSCLTAVCFAVGAFGSVGSTLAATFAEAQQTHSTFTWRMLGWQDLLSASRSWVEWLLGAPFSSGYARTVEGGLTTVSPHNYYVHIVLRLGLVGLVLLLAMYALAWRRLPRSSPASLGLRLLIVSQLVFCVGYSLFPEQGLLLGLCLWRVRACMADRDPEKTLADMPTPSVDQGLREQRNRVIFRSGAAV
ncbi:O-antigen ligase family protein [Streptomyces himalayensis]|uniref:O-antigen ligase family protein n=1 Tax=Streptomyces himalayensis subsp. himalayensis TaxID=2756131 RepID=A0A7W0I7I6_9ACTN|nr:O-antigen ligase family protein [Streptomyces himalayensis]MBA2945198.1 O-antigen ligase family protein [Streptomyces himalayensis subsp. himalayensis]